MTTEKKPLLSWRKEPKERGLAGTARAAHSAYGYDLWLGHEHLAWVRQFAGHGCWYWYGCGINTLNRTEGERTFATAHEAKCDATAFAKAWLKKREPK